MNKYETITIGGKPIKLSNPNKIFWPELNIKKIDVIKYYEKVADHIMPYLNDKPESLNRYPNGIEGKHFYQKNINFNIPDFAETKTIVTRSAKTRYLLCQNTPTLIFMANLGCIEINPWSSRYYNIEKPDYLVLDLDPLGIDLKYVCETAQVIRDILESIKIKAYIKTSGATGLHIYVPADNQYTYEQIKNFAKIIAIKTNKKIPQITSIERNPSKRTNKVYIDFLQNNLGQTMAAPYSLRPVRYAQVSTPLNWQEVNEKLNPKNFDMRNIFSRIKEKGDIFKPVLGKGFNLEKSISLLEG